MATSVGPHKQGYFWCKYCEQFVVNNASCTRVHNDSITHKVNVKKYEKKMKKERIMKEEKERDIDAQLEIIKKKAEEQYLKNDVKKEGDKSLLIQHISNSDELEMAKSLYGEDFVDNVVLTEKKSIDKTKVYNDFMKSLPTKIQAKYRQQINDFK